MAKNKIINKSRYCLFELNIDEVLPANTCVFGPLPLTRYVLQHKSTIYSVGFLFRQNSVEAEPRLVSSPRASDSTTAIWHFSTTKLVANKMYHLFPMLKGAFPWERDVTGKLCIGGVEGAGFLFA